MSNTVVSVVKKWKKQQTPVDAVENKQPDNSNVTSNVTV